MDNSADLRQMNRLTEKAGEPKATTWKNAQMFGVDLFPHFVWRTHIIPVISAAILW